MTEFLLRIPFCLYSMTHIIYGMINTIYIYVSCDLQTCSIYFLKKKKKKKKHVQYIFMIQYFFHSICIVYPMLLTTMPLINRPNYLGYTPSPFSFRRFFVIPIKKHQFCFYPYSIKNGNLYEPFLFLFFPFK